MVTTQRQQPIVREQNGQQHATALLVFCALVIATGMGLVGLGLAVSKPEPRDGLNHPDPTEIAARVLVDRFYVALLSEPSAEWSAIVDPAYVDHVQADDATPDGAEFDLVSSRNKELTPVAIVMAGDRVVVYFVDRAADSQESAFVEILRIQNGMVVERWRLHDANDRERLPVQTPMYVYVTVPAVLQTMPAWYIQFNATGTAAAIMTSVAENPASGATPNSFAPAVASPSTTPKYQSEP